MLNRHLTLDGIGIAKFFHIHMRKKSKIPISKISKNPKLKTTKTKNLRWLFRQYNLSLTLKTSKMTSVTTLSLLLAHLPQGRRQLQLSFPKIGPFSKILVPDPQNSLCGFGRTSVREPNPKIQCLSGWGTSSMVDKALEDAHQSFFLRKVSLDPWLGLYRILGPGRGCTYPSQAAARE